MGLQPTNCESEQLGRVGDCSEVAVGSLECSKMEMPQEWIPPRHWESLLGCLPPRKKVD